MIIHPIEPLYDNHSKILILGSFPSVKSRETEFFYGHPQNRFWKVISTLCQEEVPKSIDEKKSLVLKHGIALWDVIHSCDIVGSSDSSIKNVVPNDISPILEKSSIQRIFTNGKTSYRLYNQYIRPKIGIDAVCLPSTSPANAAWNLQRLLEEWKQIDFNHIPEPFVQK